MTDLPKTSSNATQIPSLTSYPAKTLPVRSDSRTRAVLATLMLVTGVQDGPYRVTYDVPRMLKRRPIDRAFDSWGSITGYLRQLHFVQPRESSATCSFASSTFIR